jgi:hypothetical protein
MYDEDEDWNEFLGLLDQFLWFAELCGIIP